MSNQEWKQCGLCAFNVPKNAKICGHCHAKFVLVENRGWHSIWYGIYSAAVMFGIEWVSFLAFIPDFLGKAGMDFLWSILLVINIPISAILAIFIYRIVEKEARMVEKAIKD